MRNRYFVICILITLAALIAGLVLYPQLPERVPSHWNAHGRINGYESRLTTVLLIPGMMAALMVVFAFLPALSPRRFEVTTFQSTYLYLMVVIVALMGYFHALLLWAAFSPQLPMNRAVAGGICVLLVLIGNVLGRVRRNFYVGIRTPWTLANERVWYATHRLGGRVLVWAGFLGLILCFVLPNPVWIIALFAGAGLIPFVYSFVFYKRLEREGVDL
jgi:uncharacterized membrane protein